ncbi:hypothetical protein NQ318_012870 [Aromia moschata]|uniref:EF-hand domain-containing protein n=1 Tax=Aromia moschata TaxID=1265417 RepID=A0AAV8YD87_9CUCU|nr:hypothetical protein NQ318_012870 [Aromia moschata]
METSSVDEQSKSSRDNSIKDLAASQSSLKSTKSLDKSSTGGSGPNSTKNMTIKSHYRNDPSLKISLLIGQRTKLRIYLNDGGHCQRLKLRMLLRKLIALINLTAIMKAVGSVHIWTTWVDRFSVDSSEGTDVKSTYQLTTTQINKLSHFFICLLDHDQDNLISFTVNDITYITKEGWLYKWSALLSKAKNLCDFPVWMQFFVKVLFQVVNRSGTGIITRDELSSFYSSVLGLDAVKVGEILDLAYQAMTSNGDHPLHYKSYRKISQWTRAVYFGCPPNSLSSIMFPIDYSALNAQPEDLEQYAPDQKIK